MQASSVTSVFMVICLAVSSTPLQRRTVGVSVLPGLLGAGVGVGVGPFVGAGANFGAGSIIGTGVASDIVADETLVKDMTIDSGFNDDSNEIVSSETSVQETGSSNVNGSKINYNNAKKSHYY